MQDPRTGCGAVESLTFGPVETNTSAVERQMFDLCQSSVASFKPCSRSLTPTHPCEPMLAVFVYSSCIKSTILSVILSLCISNHLICDQLSQIQPWRPPKRSTRSTSICCDLAEGCQSTRHMTNKSHVTSCLAALLNITVPSTVEQLDVKPFSFFSARRYEWLT